MKEEQVTKSLLGWLTQNNWQILCYDFPQSGTGRVLHPNDKFSEKNKGSIIPDVVAYKDNSCIFCEDKDRFYLADYRKQNMIKTERCFSDAIASLLQDYSVQHLYFGICFPTQKYSKVAVAS